MAKKHKSTKNIVTINKDSKDAIHVHKDKVFSITSFVCGLLFWLPLFNVLLGVLAVIFGILALKRIRDHPDRYGGEWMAIVGIILGVVSVVFTVIGVYVTVFKPELSLNTTGVTISSILK